MKPAEGKRAAARSSVKKKTVRGNAANQWRAGGTDAGKKPVALLAILCAAAIGIGILGQTGVMGTIAHPGESPVRISEVMTSNASALIMEDGSLPDWIEIENISENTVELSGYCLMIESDPTSAYTFGHSILQPGEQLVVYADNNVSARGYHAPFKLSASGETIALLDKGGDGADMVSVPELNRDQAWAGMWRATGKRRIRPLPAR